MLIDFFFFLKTKTMELAKGFEEATATIANNSICINSLIMNRPYPKVHAERVSTKYGPKLLLSLRDSDGKLVQIILPKRYENIVTDEDMEKINSRSIHQNLVCKGICELTRSYLLARNS